METILENPMTIVVVGVALSGLLLLVAANLGQWKLFYAAIALVVLTALVVAISIITETDREILKRTIHEVATALRQNDHQQALSYMHPNATPAIKRAEQEISQYEFHEAHVTSIRSIEVNKSSQPPTAITEFLATMKVSNERALSGVPVRGLRLLKVYWMKRGDRWLIHDYEHFDAREGILR